MSATVLLLALSLGGVKAQPCRPTVACTAELVPAGHLEAEVGGAGTTSSQSLNVLVKVSLLDWLQLQGGTDNFLVRSGAGLSAIDGGLAVLKARLLAQDSWWPTISLSTKLVMPTRPNATGVQQTIDFVGTAHVSKDLGPLHADLNGTVLVYGGAQVQGQGALAVSGGLPASLGAALEVHSTFGNARLANDGGVRAVVTWSPVDWLVFDVGGDVGFFPTTRAWSLFGGLTLVLTST